MKSKILSLALLALATTSTAVTAADVGFIYPASGKEACITKDFVFNEQQTKMEMCVTQGSFSHDVYTLKIAGNQVIKTIDDAVDKGLKVNHKGAIISLVCSPLNLPPNVTAEQVQSALPGYPDDKTNSLVTLMKDAVTSVEISRACVSTVNGEKQLTAQVIFE